MVKETLKQMFKLVDTSNKEELEAALLALSTDNIEAEATEEVAEALTFGEATLEDGETKIYFPGDDLTEGSTIYTDEDQTTTATAGEYVIDNGDVVSVNEDGVVTGIVATGGDEDAPVDEVEEDLQEDEEKVVSQVEEIFEALAPVFNEINSRLDALEGNNAELSKENIELKKTNEELSTKVEKLGKASSGKPFTEEKDNDSTQHAFSKHMSGYQKALKSGEYSSKRNR